MIFNTDTLGYKLVNGTLKKHSEQLNKYVAGLLDSDGYMSFEFIKDKVYVRMGISQAATVDTDSQMLRALRRHYKLGNISYTYQDNGVAICHWRLGTKDANILWNRVGKHMRIKQTHFKFLLDRQPEAHLFTREELTESSRLSRANTRWFKRPKHLSYAYVAGLLDGDGCYRIRKKHGVIVSMCVKAAIQEDFILEKLQEDFKGSINKHSENMRCWRRGLGKGHKQFAIPFLKKMRQYSCIERKYEKIDEMLRYLQATETKRLDTGR